MCIGNYWCVGSVLAFPSYDLHHFFLGGGGKSCLCMELYAVILVSNLQTCFSSKQWRIDGILCIFAAAFTGYIIML